MKFSILALILVSTIFIQNSEALQNKSVVDYSLYAQVLATYVNDEGLVNYKSLKKDMVGLNKFIQQVEKADLTSLTANEEKAFWINAYNAITLKTVVDAYPIKGIRRINFGLVWEIPRKVAGKKLGLGHIEHKILRPLGDPRIHFAINCASIGCPKLSNTPFYPKTLDAQLDKEVKRFVNDETKVRLKITENTLYISAIFDWFDGDFLVKAPNLKSYVALYIEKEKSMYLRKNNVKVEVLDYDWGLNKQ